MAKWDLDQAATALWIPAPNYRQIKSAVVKARCLMSAQRCPICYGRVAPGGSGHGHDTNQSGTVSIEEIEKLYKKIKS